MEQSTIAIIILIGVVVLYATEKIPLAVTSLTACILMSATGIIPYADAFSGFKSHIIMLVVGMTIIGEAFFETGLANKIGENLIKITGTNEKVFITIVIIIAATFSAFMSNTATVAMFMPIIATVTKSSMGRITKKNTFMALGFAGVAGGSCTLVGSTPQLVAQGILMETPGLRPLGFFELSLGGVFLIVLLVVYFTTFGYVLQKKTFDFEEVYDEIDHRNSEVAIQADSNIKMAIVGITLILCIVGFILQIWNLGMIALTGGIVCIITGCMSLEKVYEKMHWDALVIVGSALSFTKGLTASGAGKIIAESIIGVFGNNAPPWLFFSLIVLLATVCGNFMTVTGTTAMLTPIGIFVAQSIGMNPVTQVIGIILGANLAYSTPVGTLPITLTLKGGYRFMDYVKVGGLLNVLAYILLIIVVPVFYGL